MSFTLSKRLKAGDFSCPGPLLARIRVLATKVCVEIASYFAHLMSDHALKLDQIAGKAHPLRITVSAKPAFFDFKPRGKKMKKILLSSAAVFAFAGAAAAEVSFSGTASLGWNNDNQNGIYADLDIDLSLSQELNNGWTAGATFGFELDQLKYGGTTPTPTPAPSSGVLDGFSADANWVISLTSDMGGLYYGETTFAAEDHWSGVNDMAQDGFSEQDVEEVLKLNAMFGDWSASYSGLVDVPTQSIAQDSFGLSGSVSDFTVSLGYQSADNNAGLGSVARAAANGDYNANELFGIAVGGTFAGATVTVAYASDQTANQDSTGIQIAYPVGPVTATAWFVSESAFSDDTYGVKLAYADGPLAATAMYKSVATTGGTNDTASLEGSYDVGGGVMVYAGIVDENNFAGGEDGGNYIAVTYDLGGGASFLASYGDAQLPGDDEFGANDYKDGATVQVSFKF